MKKIWVIILYLSLMANCYAQDIKPFYDPPYTLRNSGSFSKKTMLLGAGIGFRGVTNVTISNSYPVEISYSPTFHFDFEHGLFRDDVGIGISVVSSWGTTTSQYIEERNSTDISILGFYHFNKLISFKKLDCYAGFGILHARYSINGLTFQIN